MVLTSPKGSSPAERDDEVLTCGGRAVAVTVYAQDGEPVETALPNAVTVAKALARSSSKFEEILRRINVKPSRR